MSIFDKINNDIKKAMLAKDKERLTALRAAKSAFLLTKTESGDKNITSEKEISIIQKLVKQRRESAEIYKEQGRKDLYQQEITEADVLSEYLPEQLSEVEIAKVIEKVIAETDSTTMKDMGKVMGVASKQLAGKADNKMISKIVKEKLS